MTVGGLVVLGGGLMVAGGVPQVNNALSVWFVEDDPARIAYESFQDLFGNDEVVILSVGTPGTRLAPDLREAMASTAAGLAGVEGVASVTGPDDASAGPLASLLLNPEESVALLMVRLDVMDDADARRHDILVALKEGVGSLAATGAELHWAGIGLVYDELNEASFRETPLLTGASFLVVGLVLYVTTGSLAAVAIALSSVVVSIMILMGVFTLAGFQLNMVTAILPTLLLVVGTATAVHIFARLRRMADESVDDALRAVFKPCLFTSLTTAAGFASLMTARMAVIRDLGAFAALGVLISLVACFAFVWALPPVRWMPVGPSREPRSRAFLEILAGWATAYPRCILGGALVVTGLALWTATKVVVDTYSIEFFRADHPVRVDSDAVENGYGWYLPLEFAVHAPSPGGALDPGLVRSVATWQERVRGAGTAAWSLSVADFLREGTSAAAMDPAAAGLVDEGASALRVTFGVPMASARAWEERIDAIRASAEGAVPPEMAITSGGYLPLYVRMMQYIVDTQLRSFAVALILVFSLMAVFLRAPRMVLVAVFPNLLPILMVFGVMGVVGIRLDIATVTVAAIALGIVVDDTVHLLFHFRNALDATGDSGPAVRSALLAVGPALVGTTVILASSFAVLGFASVRSIALFGLLSATTLIFALASDLLVLPSLLMVFGPKPASPASSRPGDA